MRALRRIVLAGLLAAVGVILIGGGSLAYVIVSRETPKAVPSTTHPTIARSRCPVCHAPIAEEWRTSYHSRSLSGPYWKEADQLGYLDLFARFRKPCVNCHAPANVLDLGGPDGRGAGAARLGVECTPALLRDPSGTIPAARSDDVEMGVDCTACHVSAGGIAGSGRRPTDAHEVSADARFQDPAAAVEGLCRVCHGAAVAAWRRTPLPASGVTCLDCHMPLVTAAVVAGGPERPRRSHRFLADKDPEMLRRALHASLRITPDRVARLRIRNDQVGHYFPSGGNWLSVVLEARDRSGRPAGRQVATFGKEEPLLLDFSPFNADRRIPFGQEREVLLPLPAGGGRVEAVVRYHDWMRVRATIGTFEEPY